MDKKNGPDKESNIVSNKELEKRRIKKTNEKFAARDKAFKEKIDLEKVRGFFGKDGKVKALGLPTSVSGIKAALNDAKKFGSKITPKKIKALRTLLLAKQKGKPKPPIKKKSGGRLSDGTAFINSLYKDKL